MLYTGWGKWSVISKYFVNKKKHFRIKCLLSFERDVTLWSRNNLEWCYKGQIKVNLLLITCSPALTRTSLFTWADKQQELDLPSLRIEDAVAAAGSADARAAKKKDRAQRGPAAMSHISGVKRPLTHTNSFTGERVPLHGVETPHEEQLGKVSFWPFTFHQMSQRLAGCNGSCFFGNTSYTFIVSIIYYFRDIVDPNRVAVSLLQCFCNNAAFCISIIYWVRPDHWEWYKLESCRSREKRKRKVERF